MDVKTREIFFAGGSFWGIERFLQLIAGVTDTQVGYANSSVPSPSYDKVCSGCTGATETVKVLYDPEQIDLFTLVDLFLKGIKHQSEHRKGNDVGSQYRFGIYSLKEHESMAIYRHLHFLNECLGVDLGVEVCPLINFYPAEDYHQNYLLYHPNGYCQLDQAAFTLAQSYKPKVYKKAADAKLQKTLTSTQYVVTQQGATERPYVNKYCNNDEPGIYVDITTGQPLFTSKSKINEKYGWPSFSSPISDDVIVKRKQQKYGREIIELRSALGDAHLGHMYTEHQGRPRYSVNSAALRFIPAYWLEALGYGEYAELC